MLARSDAGLELEVLWSDVDGLELRVRASNGPYACLTDLYVGSGDLAKLAEAVRGFPSSASDAREFTLGTFEPGHAGGGIRLELTCASARGHALLSVHLRTEQGVHGPIEASATFAIPVEAAEIDRWAAQLPGLESDHVGARARLAMAR